MDAARLRRRRLLAAPLVLIPPALALGFGHRGVHAARSLIVPGAGLVESRPAAAAVLLAAAIAATVAWLRWGADWGVVLVTIVAAAASARWGSDDHVVASAPALVTGRAVVRAAHEFPLVIAIAGAIGALRTALVGLPGGQRLRGRASAADEQTPLDELPVGDRCRAATIAALAGSTTQPDRDAVLLPDVAARARRVGAIARLRLGGDPFRIDHAHLRSARVATGVATDLEIEQLAADADRSCAGVPASEPTWVRPLDAVLTAAVLERNGRPASGRAVSALLAGSLRCRRGHRPAWWWTPLGVGAGRALDWEHAAATGIARAQGWIGDDDWPVLRQRVLGAAARGSARRDDERLIAAGRIWLALVDDPTAAAIVARPTVVHDPLARSLDSLATHLRASSPHRSHEEVLP